MVGFLIAYVAITLVVATGIALACLIFALGPFMDGPSEINATYVKAIWEAFLEAEKYILFWPFLGPKTFFVKVDEWQKWYQNNLKKEDDMKETN